MIQSTVSEPYSGCERAGADRRPTALEHQPFIRASATNASKASAPLSRVVVASRCPDRRAGRHTLASRAPCGRGCRTQFGLGEVREDLARRPFPGGVGSLERGVRPWSRSIASHSLDRVPDRDRADRDRRGRGCRGWWEAVAHLTPRPGRRFSRCGGRRITSG